MDSGSVSHWIKQVKAGEESAATHLWQRYQPQLLDIARRKLNGGRGPTDEEDVVVDALASFFQRTKGGRFPDLQDREGLWRLLVTITNRKAINQIAHETRQKRGAGKAPGELREDATPKTGPETAPDHAMIVAESLAAMLESLSSDELREIAMAKLEGCSNQEIADRIDYSVPTVERRLRLIRSELQEFVDADES